MKKQNEGVMILIVTVIVAIIIGAVAVLAVTGKTNGTVIKKINPLNLYKDESTTNINYQDKELDEINTSLETIEIGDPNTDINDLNKDASSL